MPIVQAIVTVIAVVVGGLWTYKLFIEERGQFPHANIEQNISHVALSEQANLLRVGIDLTNAGRSLMRTGKATIRVQQILPWLPCDAGSACAKAEVVKASGAVMRQTNGFPWPLIAERELSPFFDIEPGEKQNLDFEFVTPSDVKVVRVYTYFRNDQKSADDDEVGWATSSYYDFNASKIGAAK